MLCYELEWGMVYRLEWEMVLYSGVETGAFQTEVGNVTLDQSGEWHVIDWSGEWLAIDWSGEQCQGKLYT